MGMTEADAAASAEEGVLVPEPRRKFMSKRKGEWELSEDAKDVRSFVEGGPGGRRALYELGRLAALEETG